MAYEKLNQYSQEDFIDTPFWEIEGGGSGSPFLSCTTPPSPPPSCVQNNVPCFKNFRATICDPKPRAAVVDPDDPETWGEWTAAWGAGGSFRFLGDTLITWNTTYEIQIGDFFMSDRAWKDSIIPTNSKLFNSMTTVQQNNVRPSGGGTGRYTMWEVTWVDDPCTWDESGSTRRRSSACTQGVRFMCHPGTPANPLQWCDTWPIGTPGAPHTSFNACMNDPICLPYIPDSYECSGASGVGHPTGLTWTCYDPGTGLGTYSSSTICESNCPAISYKCSGATGDSTTPTPWTCYDPLDGTGNYLTQGACETMCPEVTYVCNSLHTILQVPECGNPTNVLSIPKWQCYDPCDGTGTTLSLCEASCPEESWHCNNSWNTWVNVPLGDGTTINVPPWSCYDPLDGTGPHASQTACEVLCPPESYNCPFGNSTLPTPPLSQNNWTCTDPGDGSGYYSVANNYINPLQACQDDCVAPTAECSGPNGITLPAPIGTVPPWHCYDPLNGTGSFQENANSIPPWLPAILVCGGWSSVTGPPPCREPDPEYNCSEFGDANMSTPWTCYVVPAGTTGQFTGPLAQTQCQNVCYPPESWDCDIPWRQTVGNCTDPGTGLGQYSLANNYTNPQQDCLDACREHTVLIPFTGPDVSWNCQFVWDHWHGTHNYTGNCDAVLGFGGAYSTEQSCLDACRERQVVIDRGFVHPDSWRCHIPRTKPPTVIGNCFVVTDGTGHATEQDCIDACRPCEPILPDFPYVGTCTDWRGCETVSCPCGWTAISDGSWQWGWKCEKTLNGITKTRKPYVIFCHRINGVKPYTGDIYLLEQYLFGGGSSGTGNTAFSTGYQDNTTETFGVTTITWDSAFVVCPGIKDPWANYPLATHHTMSEQQLLLLMTQQNSLFFYADTPSSICTPPPITLPVGIDHG